MKWLDRLVARLHKEPDPFDCAWCGPEGTRTPQHEMCTGKAVRLPRATNNFSMAQSAPCACAVRGHGADRNARPSHTPWPRQAPPPQRPD